MNSVKPMPVIFIGHGNPMNALERNAYTESWAAIGESIPRPKAVLVISAHWYVPGTAVTAMAAPRTIHDFGGFPDELFQVRYPASGNPALANGIKTLLAPIPVALDQQWGLDHGAWSVLCHVFPKADIPVLQLSMDVTQPAAFHYDLGKRLSALRDEGVLIIGSGNVVHNLRAYAWGQGPVEAYDWAIRFESQLRELLIAGNDESLINYASLGHDARLAVPTPEHYLPLLYVLGLRQTGEPLRFVTEGIEGGSISMLSMQIG